MRNDDKIFIPLTLDNSTNSAWGNGQFLGVIAAAIAAILLQVGLLMYYGDNTGLKWTASPLFLIPLDLALLYFIVWLVRKFVFKEGQLLKAYRDNKNNQVSDLGFMWDIFNIEHNRIYYLNGYVGAVVQFRHGYIFDRPELHRDIHRQTIQQAIGSLAKKGYQFRFYNREVKDSNLDSLYETKRKISKNAGSDSYNLITDILNHTERVCTDIATIEVETYVVIATDMYTIQGLDVAVEEMIAATRNGLYTFAERMDDVQIYNFICNLYGITSINVDDILSRKFRDKQLQVVRELEVYRDASVPVTEQTSNYQDSQSDSAFEEYLKLIQSNTEPEEGDDYL